MPVQIPATRKTPDAHRSSTTSSSATTPRPRRWPRCPSSRAPRQMTAANSTPLTDGASAVVLAIGEAADELGVEPLARVRLLGGVRARPAHHGPRARLGDAARPPAGRL